MTQLSIKLSWAFILVYLVYILIFWILVLSICSKLWFMIHSIEVLRFERGINIKTRSCINLLKCRLGILLTNISILIQLSEAIITLEMMMGSKLVLDCLWSIIILIAFVEFLIKFLIWWVFPLNLRYIHLILIITMKLSTLWMIHGDLNRRNIDWGWINTWEILVKIWLSVINRLWSHVFLNYFHTNLTVISWFSCRSLIWIAIDLTVWWKDQVWLFGVFRNVL